MAERFGLSARGYHRVLRVARTIADLDGSDRVRRPHVAEAVSYRLARGRRPEEPRAPAARLPRTGSTRRPPCRAGDKSAYTDKQKRQAEHIAEGYEERGVPHDEAEGRAWATVNAEAGGGKKSGSGRGKARNHAPSRRGGERGGAASASRPAADRSESAKKAAGGAQPEERSASAKKAAATRKRNAEARRRPRASSARPQEPGDRPERAPRLGHVAVEHVPDVRRALATTPASPRPPPRGAGRPRRSASHRSASQ